MKETIKLPRKSNILIYSIFGFCFLMIIIWLSVNTISYKKEIQELQRKKINGLIVQSKKETRGFYYIEINDNVSKTILRCSLPGSWFYIENKIIQGDSVSKKANDKTLVFFKLRNGLYEKCCEHDINF